MNLAQVIDFDTEKRTYRIVHDKAYQPNRRGTASAVVVREHRSPPQDDRPAESGVRRALRAAGREVLAVLRASTERLTFTEISQALPHVAQTTLQVRLSTMVLRGDVIRDGDYGGFRYGASSTAECS